MINTNDSMNNSSMMHGVINDVEHDLLTAKRFAITTIDNPFDPFDDFINWFVFDTIVKKYNTCGRLARLCPDFEQLSEQESLKLLEEAIDFMVLNDPLQLYVKVEEGIKYNYPLNS